MEVDSLRLLATAAVIIGGTLFPALAIGKIGSSGLEAIGRNPEASGTILTNMILAIAFAEALGIYALVVAILLAMVV